MSLASCSSRRFAVPAQRLGGHVCSWSGLQTHRSFRHAAQHLRRLQQQQVASLPADAQAAAAANASSGSLPSVLVTPPTAATLTPTSSSSSSSGGPSQPPAPPEEPNRVALYQAVGAGAAVSVVAGIVWHDWVEAHQALAMYAVFCIGYLGIITEEVLGINKAAISLLMAVSLWTIRSTGGDTAIDAEVAAALAQVSELLFFLLGAMTVVEVVDAHDGFKPLATAVRTDDRRHLAVLVAGGSFFLSSVLDNLTTTIVVLSLLQRLVPNDKELRLLLGSITVVAANAGGAWTPIGDVTTTMLWIHGQLSPLPTIRDLFLPSFISVVVPIAILATTCPELKGPVITSSPATPTTPSSSSSSSSSSIGTAADGLELGAVTSYSQVVSSADSDGQQAQAGTNTAATTSASSSSSTDALDPSVLLAGLSAGTSTSALANSTQVDNMVGALATTTATSSSSSSSSSSSTPSGLVSDRQRGNLVLAVGLASLLSVPAFKYLTGLPPFMGMLSGLGVLWMLTDALHVAEDRRHPRVDDALRNLDLGGVMFFLGILMAVEALDSAGLLRQLAEGLATAVPNVDIIAAVVGLASAVVDNVPLVAATMGMYDIAAVPPDSQLWQLIALCAGTGGSLLVVGSAAGVAFMSMEGAGFGWYARRITPGVLVGYGAAIAAYVAAHGLPGAGAVPGA